MSIHSRGLLTHGWRDRRRCTRRWTLCRCRTRQSGTSLPGCWCCWSEPRRTIRHNTCEGKRSGLHRLPRRCTARITDYLSCTCSGLPEQKYQGCNVGVWREIKTLHTWNKDKHVLAELVRVSETKQIILCNDTWSGRQPHTRYGSKAYDERNMNSLNLDYNGKQLSWRQKVRNVFKSRHSSCLFFLSWGFSYSFTDVTKGWKASV